jgi:hypothetical protein
MTLAATSNIIVKSLLVTGTHGTTLASSLL